ncbi:MAG TPA: peptidoglycan-binding domain-containing protein [Bryobacteraceae bacterium]|nr:peptidoglycan-binding domain-containing protein [Bryobacteraceae bacterium]
MLNRLTVALVLVPALAMAASKKPQPAAKAPAKAASKNSAVRKTSVRRKTAARVSRPRASRATQTTPTPERYKQIQEALAAKGYLPADQATGQWNDASVDALKRFQADQKIDSTGKINSLSLIALGLGPKHDSLAKGASTGGGPAAPASQQPSLTAR